MALKIIDKLKTIDLSKATEVISGLKTSSSDKVSKQVEDKEHAIDCIDSLNDYLQELKYVASPSVMQALQSQLQLLKFVQSPTMTLMAVDNIMVCLHKALKNAEDEQTKEALREVFTTLLQSFIFVSEARLKYEIDNNREESVHLLSDAGDMLMDSVRSTAMMVSLTDSDGVATLATKPLPKMTNVLATTTEKDSFIGRLISVKGKKAVIEEKKKDFDKTLIYIFETLDNYSEMVGPSIQMHGMLKRYADQLVENYTLTQYASVAKSLNEKEGGRLDALVESVEQFTTTRKDKTLMGSLLGTVLSKVSPIPVPSDLGDTAQMLLGSLTQVMKSPTKHDYESVRNIKRSLQSEMEKSEAELVLVDEKIENINNEIKSLSILQFNRKGNLQKQIDSLNESRDKIKKTILNYKNRINIVTDVIDPVNEKVLKYGENLYRIVKKYEYNI